MFTNIIVLLSAETEYSKPNLHLYCFVFTEFNQYCSVQKCILVVHDIKCQELDELPVSNLSTKCCDLLNYD